MFSPLFWGWGVGMAHWHNWVRHTGTISRFLTHQAQKLGHHWSSLYFYFQYTSSAILSSPPHDLFLSVYLFKPREKEEKQRQGSEQRIVHVRTHTPVYWGQAWINVHSGHALAPIWIFPPGSYLAWNVPTGNNVFPGQIGETGLVVIQTGIKQGLNPFSMHIIVTIPQGPHIQAEHRKHGSKQPSVLHFNQQKALKNIISCAIKIINVQCSFLIFCSLSLFLSQYIWQFVTINQQWKPIEELEKVRNLTKWADVSPCLTILCNSSGFISAQTRCSKSVCRNSSAIFLGSLPPPPSLGGLQGRMLLCA